MDDLEKEVEDIIKNTEPTPLRQRAQVPINTLDMSLVQQYQTASASDMQMTTANRAKNTIQKDQVQSERPTFVEENKNDQTKLEMYDQTLTEKNLVTLQDQDKSIDDSTAQLVPIK